MSSAAIPTGAKGRPGRSRLPMGPNFLLRKTRGDLEAPGPDFWWPGRGPEGELVARGRGARVGRLEDMSTPAPGREHPGRKHGQPASLHLRDRKTSIGKE